MSNICYHCGLPVPEHTHFHTKILGEQRDLCCAGCHAVAYSIVEAGLENYYQHRTAPAHTAQELVPEFLRQVQVYDNDTVQQRFVHFEGENVREAALILEGITCAACIWLNERHIRALAGVLEVQINYSTQRARVRWDNSVIKLSAILAAISHIGYFAHPYDPARQQQILEQERRSHLRRLGVSAALGMQVMMFSIALYTEAWSGNDMALEFKSLFYWISLILTVPVMFYGADVFIRNAWRDLKYKQVGMDVPISVGLLLAFLGSLWHTLTMSGEVYYDSITMFVFLVLGARYFELMARQRSARAAESLVKLVPETATRLRDNGSETVLVAELRVGDRLLIKPGEAIAADGSVIVGASEVDESLLTGESVPVAKNIGSTVIAGSVNIDSPLHIQVEKVGIDTVLSHILRLLERAQSEKPYITQVADRIASVFVLGVLVLATAVAAYWWRVAPELWLEITLSVLVVTCPCALSLATPAALTAATGALARLGLLTTRGHAVETLARASHFIFDKTGTLTVGRLQLLHHHIYVGDSDTLLKRAAALESHSEHPIAKALRDASPGPQRPFERIKNTPGAGVEGELEGQHWYLGTADFIYQNTHFSLPQDELNRLESLGTLVLFANHDHIAAAFILGDQIRPGAAELIAGLQRAGKQVYLLTGDHAQAAAKVAQQVGIKNYAHSLKPEDKLKRVQALQDQGAIVAMCGDGVNDAPVLAKAQVSIAMGAGTQVARASADMVLLSDDMPMLLRAQKISQRTLNIIRQNLAWALAYNILALPAAAMGMVSPWMAAVGMSLSSLLVVANALRLTRSDHAHNENAGGIEK
jgi:P-type Cu2+ transporter